MESCRLKFASSIQPDEYRLFEISDTLLQELLATKGNDTFQIRGNSNDSAVLVSKNKTFSIKLAETSNSIFLVDPTGKKRKNESSSEEEGDEKEENGIENKIKDNKEENKDLELKSSSKRKEKNKKLKKIQFKVL